jgi:elongation factor P
MSGAMHARLRNLDTGTIWEHAFRSELKVEEMPLDKHTLKSLCADENHCCFMDPDSFEQTEIPMAIIGVQAQFLEAGMRLAVEVVAGRPINVSFRIFWR